MDLGKKLLTARQASGLSTRAVAERLGPRVPVSHATIANYEKGVSRPTMELLSILAGIYERPLNWFLSDGTVLEGVQYRNLKSKVRVKDKQAFEGSALRWLEAYYRLEELLDRPLERKGPPPRITPKDSPDLAASKLRDALKLAADAPVPSVIDALEHFGVRVLELPTALGIDGIAAGLGDVHVVVLSSEVSNDRCRLNAAHELAHVVCGDTDHVGQDKGREDRAFSIASHFLLPDPMLRMAFEGRSMVRMVNFKERFGISLAAMIYRAEKSKIIPAKDARYLWIEFAKRGWRVKEPGYVRPDRATRFEQLVEYAVHHKKMTVADLAARLGVRESELQHRLQLALGVLNPQDVPGEKGAEPGPRTLKIRP